jgi:FixJ family two-component response regulator
VADLRRVVGVIDDDLSVRQALVRLLRTAGLDVLLFETAEDFLSDRDRRRIDFLVIDVRLPGISGLELLTQIRNEATPALLITAHDDDRLRDRALAAGAVGFFLKPFNNRQLISTVKEALHLEAC